MKKISDDKLKKIKEDWNLKPAGEIKSRVRELRHEIGKLRLEIKAGREKNTRKLFNKRKELARALTALRTKREV